jgi:hypothetical protein
MIFGSLMLVVDEQDSNFISANKTKISLQKEML